MAMGIPSREITDLVHLIEDSKYVDYSLEINDDGNLKTSSWFSYTWRKILSIFIGSRAFKSSHPLAIAEKVELVFNKHYNSLSKGNALTFHYFFDTMAKRWNSKDCAAKINEISSRVFDKVIIIPKLKLVQRAIK
ncbi:MAG TPA: hypothetical protein VGP47_09310, partial [Parachlamydiaceae bacterium]|nr:hypothetical protein [Parachlamydiaceae bacterium]